MCIHLIRVPLKVYVDICIHFHLVPPQDQEGSLFWSFSWELSFYEKVGPWGQVGPSRYEDVCKCILYITLNPTPLCIYIYIYVYTYVQISVYILIYIYTFRKLCGIPLLDPVVLLTSKRQKPMACRGCVHRHYPKPMPNTLNRKAWTLHPKPYTLHAEP